MIRKRTALLLYAALLLIPGLLIVFLGGAFADIPSFSSLDGAGSFVQILQLIGGVLIAVGMIGVGWAISLTDNPALPGYAGLTRPGFVAFLVPLLLSGPFWLLIGWVLWLIPAFRARH